MLGQIPFEAVDRYATRYGIVGLDDFDTFRRLIRAMDAFYIAWKPDQGGEQRGSIVS